MHVRVVDIEPDHIVRLAVEGRMTAGAMPDNEQPHLLAQTVGDHWANLRIVLSLANAPAIDSTGVGWLLASKTEFDRAGGRLVVHSVPAAVEEMFELLRVERVVPVAGDEAEALRMVRGEQSPSPERPGRSTGERGA